MTGRSHLTSSCPAHPSFSPASVAWPSPAPPTHLHPMFPYQPGSTYTASVPHVFCQIVKVAQCCLCIPASVFCYLFPETWKPATCQSEPLPDLGFPACTSSPASLFQKPPQNKSLNCISLSSLFTSGYPPLLPLNVTPCLIHDLWHFSGICLVAPALFFKRGVRWGCCTYCLWAKTFVVPSSP